MDCYICKLHLDDGAGFCGNCGAPVRAIVPSQDNPPKHPYSTSPPTHRSYQETSQDRSWAGIIALLSGLVSLIGLGPAVCGVAASFSAIVFGIVGWNTKRRWMAIVGMALGLLLFCISAFRLAASSLPGLESWMNYGPLSLP